MAPVRSRPDRNRGNRRGASRFLRETDGSEDWLAERVGFEPTVPFRVHALSRRVPSTARPSLLGGLWRRGRDSNPRPRSSGPPGKPRLRATSTRSASWGGPAHRRGESRANPNRPTCQQRKTRAAAAGSPRPRSLRFGDAIARPPKPRGIAGISPAPRGSPERRAEARTEWRRE